MIIYLSKNKNCLRIRYKKFIIKTKLKQLILNSLKRIKNFLIYLVAKVNMIYLIKNK